MLSATYLIARWLSEEREDQFCLHGNYFVFTLLA